MHTASRAIFCTISHKKGQCKLCREVSVLYILHTENQTLCITFCCHLDLGLLCNQEAQSLLLLSRCWFSSPLAAPEGLCKSGFVRISEGKMQMLKAARSPLDQTLTGSFACCLRFSYSENGQTQYLRNWMMNVSRGGCSNELHQAVQAMNFIRIF